MRLGLYGGSFDPVHHGHLILARDAIELMNLDRVIFIPAAISPHKLHRVPSPSSVRLRMLEEAVRGEERFTVDDCELHRTGPSFTIDTVEHVRAQHPAAQLFYFIGGDNVALLSTWRRVQELMALVQFVVFDRGDPAMSHPWPSLERHLDLSSTEIRERVARGASIRYLVPDAVRAIIEEHHLYRTDGAAA